MLINPTRGAMPLFADFARATNKKSALLFAANNPFFSWHAISAKIKGQHTVLAVNDATFTPILLAKVSEHAGNNLEQLLMTAIEQVLVASGVSEEIVQQYLEQAGTFQVYLRHNKVVSAYMTRINSLVTDQFPLDEAHSLQLAFSLWLAEQPIRENGRVTPLQKLTAISDRSFYVHPISDL